MIRVDLKAALFELSRRLVEEHGYAPANTVFGDRDAKTTDLIHHFKRFIDEADEARAVLASLGFEWIEPEPGPELIEAKLFQAKGWEHFEIVSAIGDRLRVRRPGTNQESVIGQQNIKPAERERYWREVRERGGIAPAQD